MGVPLLRHPRPGLCCALRGVWQVVLQLLRQRFRKPHHSAPRALKEQSGIDAVAAWSIIISVVRQWLDRRLVPTDIYDIRWV